MADGVKQILQTPIQLADQVTKLADDVHSSFRADCAELKSKTERLAELLRQAARADLCERPTRRIMDNTEQVLDKALALVCKCREAHGLVKRVFTIIPSAAFKKMSSLLENSIGDVSWLLRVSATGDDDGAGYLGLPPIASNEPILCLIWEQIAKLNNGSLDERADAAASLVSFARDNERYGKLIVEEGGVALLLRLIKEGRSDGQESAARAIGLLARDAESVDQMLLAGAVTVVSKILKEGPMKVQAAVAWAVAELAAAQPKCQDLFAQTNVIRLLVGHLAFETLQEHSKYSVPSKAKLSIHSVVLANKQHISLSGASSKGRDLEDGETKAAMKAMAAKALWQLTKSNPAVSRAIAESRALLCFAALLEKGPHAVQYNSAMALMEIARVAEKDDELRRSAFKPNSPACRAVVDQLLRVVDRGEPGELLLPCVTAIGCLSRTFRATETRVIGPLVRLLDEREDQVAREAAVALGKFACTGNYLHVDHCKAIIAAGGAGHLVQLVYFGAQPALQIDALVLLCYVALHVPQHEALIKAEALTVLEWASKQGFVVQDPAVEELLGEAKGALELYQSRGSRAFP
ncbi:uncharacterized protein LOC144715012 [Wolffia australiana]